MLVSAYTDYLWVGKIIRSCDKQSQKDSIIKLIHLYEKKYKFESENNRRILLFTRSLFERAEEHFNLKHIDYYDFLSFMDYNKI